ncbi:jg15816 [Pararge aegeria aegeria]|uniref:Jg15816 protein n=1 Tax=Pararge aegeria aegeria TaxID=348720 RepID=A0A8S4S6I2_9NEOP|nr:jg15816 [Pararge aegeria aegeria]
MAGVSKRIALASNYCLVYLSSDRIRSARNMCTTWKSAQTCSYRHSSTSGEAKVAMGGGAHSSENHWTLGALGAEMPTLYRCPVTRVAGNQAAHDRRIWNFRQNTYPAMDVHWLT